MVRTKIAACMVAAGTALFAQQQPPDQSDRSGVFRAVSEMVPVFVTVTDRSARLVTTLAKDQFSIRDNGRSQSIALFDNTPQPVRLIVLVDVSGSMSRNVALVRKAGIELFQRLAPDDLATVGTFGRTIEIHPEFTRDQRELVGRLPSSVPDEAPTPLWRAVNQAMDVFGDLPGRRVILIASDGKDQAVGGFGERYVGQPEVVDRAQRENVMLYALAMSSRLALNGFASGPGRLQEAMAATLPAPSFGKAAEETGGGYVEIRPRDDLDQVFARIADELHSQYLIGFVPVADGKRHEVDVRVTENGMRVRARKSYIAPKGVRAPPSRQTTE